MHKAFVLVLLLAPFCATLARADEPALNGKASWYGGKHIGRKTASGEIFTRQLRTAAHRDLPLGSVVRVVNLRNHKSVVVRINDRGPFVEGRVIDLSEQAARELNMLDQGVAEVRLEIIALN